MGWYYTTGQTKRQLVAELTTDWEHENRIGVCLCHYVGKDALWAVWEITTTDDAGATTTKRGIACDLLGKCKGDWGHKPMDESCGPYYYDCPLSFLNMVPEVNAKWRKAVRQWHRENNPAA